MGLLYLGIFFVLAGALQLFAAWSTHTRVGPLRTLQARQLESMLGRRGAAIAFGLVGTMLVLSGVGLALRALL